RRRFERPGERGEGAAARPARDVVGREERDDLVPERARLARAPLVARRLADEVEAVRRARAGRVEEVAVARHLVRPLEPPPERPSTLVVEERRAAAAARQAPLLEPEGEDNVEPARAGAHEVEHRDLTRLAGRRAAHGRPLARADENLRPHL